MVHRLTAPLSTSICTLNHFACPSTTVGTADRLDDIVVPVLLVLPSSSWPVETRRRVKDSLLVLRFEMMCCVPAVQLSGATLTTNSMSPVTELAGLSGVLAKEPDTPGRSSALAISPSMSTPFAVFHWKLRVANSLP